MKVETLIKKGIIKLEMYGSVSEHAKEYGIEAENPLFIKHLFVAESYRLKGIGTSVLTYLYDYAEKNNHDAILGHIPNGAVFTKDLNKSSFCDIDMIKTWLHKNGFYLCDGNNDFYNATSKNDVVLGGKGYSVKRAESEEDLENMISSIMDVQGGKPIRLIYGDYNDVKILVSKATEQERDKLINHIVGEIKTDTLKTFGDFDVVEERETFNYFDNSIIYMNKIELIKDKKVEILFNFMKMAERKYFKENQAKKLTCVLYANQTWQVDGDNFIDISDDDLIDVL